MTMPEQRLRAVRLRNWMLLSFALLSLLVCGVLGVLEFSGYRDYWMARTRCGRDPVIATTFAGAYVYFLPGHANYRPDFFSQYYCSEDSAKQAGFHASAT